MPVQSCAQIVSRHAPGSPPGVEVPAELAELLGRWYSEGRAVDFSVRQGRLEARGADLPEHKPSSVFEKVARMYWATYPVTRDPLPFGV